MCMRDEQRRVAAVLNVDAAAHHEMAFSSVGYAGMEPSGSGRLLDAKTFKQHDLALDIFAQRRPTKKDGNAALAPLVAAPAPALVDCSAELTPVALLDLDEDSLLEVFAYLAADPLDPICPIGFVRRTVRHRQKISQRVCVVSTLLTSELDVSCCAVQVPSVARSPRARMCSASCDARIGAAPRGQDGSHAATPR